MSTLVLMEVQRALNAKLQGDGVLMGMVTGVYDAVPQRSNLPYVVIGDGQMRVLEAQGIALHELNLELDIWTDTGGRKTALTIMNRLFSTLHLGTLTLTGFQQVTLRCEQADTELEEQGTRLHGRLNLRMIVVEV